MRYDVLGTSHQMTAKRQPMALSNNYSLRLDTDQRAKLEQIAQRKDRDLSYVIRKAIDEYIDRHQDDPD
jgi:predicted transcriptional regulator